MALRVLYLINDFGKGGAQRYLIDLCTELLNRSELDFRIGTLFEDNQYLDLTSNLPVENLSYSTFSLLRKTKNLPYKKLLETFKPHIIHTHLYLSEFLSSFYPDQNIKYVCHCHDNMVQFDNMSFNTLFYRKKLLGFIEKQYLIYHKYNKTKTFFVANSKHTEQYFKKRLPGNVKKNVILMYYGFNYYRFYDKTPKRLDVTKPIRILNVGSFQDKKNQIFLIAIAKELKSHKIHFEMNLIGDGENFNNIQKAIIENELESEIFLRGIIDNVEMWYKSNDIYLHTAWYEPFGLVFLEAMAAGVPVITLDGKGNRDIIENGKNGFLIEQQDEVVFSNTVKKLIQNPDLYSNISDYAKKYAMKFDAKIKIQELVDFYYSIEL